MYIHICIYTYIYVHIHVCIHTYIHIYIQTHIFTYINVYKHIYTYVSKYLWCLSRRLATGKQERESRWFKNRTLTKH